MKFGTGKSYGPVTMDQIKISDDDEDVEGVTSKTEFADAIITARNKDQRKAMIIKIVLGVLAASALIGIGVGIGMITSSNDNGPVNAGGAFPNGNTNGGDNDDDVFVHSGDASEDEEQRTFLVPPPHDLSDICSPNAVSTKQGFAKCQDTCSQAACCNLPGDKLSCLDANEKKCATYDAFCEILTFDHNNNGKVEVQEKVSVPPPPSNLRAMCEWDALVNIDGFQQCKSACDPGKCCFESIETCKVLNPSMCKAYDACEILHVQEVVKVPPAVSNLKDVCSPESMQKTEGYKACKDACDPGECCYEPIETCKVENPDMCEAYDECMILSGTPDTHPESVNSQVMTKCTTTNLQKKNKGGVKECQEACTPGLCCIGGLDGKSDRCNFPEYAEWCSQYDACNLLHATDEDGFDTHEGHEAIADICQDFSAEGVNKCKKVCDPAECCFKVDQDCDDVGMDDIKCHHYEACGHLYMNDKDPTTTPVQNHHSEENDLSEQDLMDMAEAIVQMCSAEALQDDDNKMDCSDICEDKLCCFADAEYNCLSTYRETCIVYAGCEPLTEFYN